MNAQALILAAGKGTRMGGTLPKVMVVARGKPLIGWVLDSLSGVGVSRSVAVVGYKKEDVVAYLPKGVEWAEQAEQRGTGHAVMCAKDKFANFDGTLLVTYGDMPLVTRKTYADFLAGHVKNGSACTVLTGIIPPPHRYGRIVRGKKGEVLRIVEAADATPEELAIDEINTGVYAFDCKKLFGALSRVKPNNKQGEYYLTDVLGIMIADGEKVEAVVCQDSSEAMGVNTPEDLAQVEAKLAAR